VKMRIMVDVDVDNMTAQQIKRSGFTVCRSGTYHQVRVAGQLLARDHGTVTISEESTHGISQEPKTAR